MRDLIVSDVSLTKFEGTFSCVEHDKKEIVYYTKSYLTFLNVHRGNHPSVQSHE